MRTYRILSFLILPLVFSCNTITSSSEILTDENADEFESNYEYWFSEELAKDNDKRPVRLQGFEPGKKSKFWLFAPYPNTENEPLSILRSLQLSNGLQLFQLTDWENNKKEIFLFYGKQPNDSTFTFYALNDNPMKNARQSEWLEPIKNQVVFQKEEIHFDSLAVSNNSERILEFLKTEFSQRGQFEADSVVFKGSNDPNSFSK